MSDVISSDLSSDDKNSWSTDPAVFEAFNREFHFVLDAAASDSNHKCDLYFTKEDDALTEDWAEQVEDCYSKSVWVNPPYGKGCIKPFMDKSYEESRKGLTVALLVPGTLEAGWVPISTASEIRVITGGRLSFHHPETGKKVSGNTKGSMLVVFRPTNDPVVVRLIDRDRLLESGKK